MPVQYKTKITAEKFLYTHAIITEPTNSLFQPHMHDSCELLMIIRGDIFYSVEGREYKLKSGDIVLSRPYVMHHIQSNSAAVYERFNVIFEEKKLPKSIRDKIPLGIDVFKLSDYERILDLFLKIDYYAQNFSGEVLTRLAINIVEEIYCNLAISSNKGRDATVNQLTDQAISYINKNLTTIRNISEICDALYITKSHLHHLFVKNIHITPKQYIISKRLMKARKMLLHGGKPTEIYTECGFDDYTTFFRNYTKHFGYSPSSECKQLPTSEILS